MRRRDMQQHNALVLFASLEEEIRQFGIAPPVPWPWAKRPGGGIDLALRCDQLIEFRDLLRASSPERIAELGRENRDAWLRYAERLIP